ncbi:LUD domain-containing protein [Oscillatoria amoena NRMC-F 0135]|nr:LUD domain-containing protein [Oscillatoria laete-virens]MDL5049148.1 LUD domain-containing protein [Oscillatoria amoena NRMC-F 0135]MDL5052186.1 LUD domain-containing protein [Oscillatoria laete-virens NRMC-F 0139]
MNPTPTSSRGKILAKVKSALSPLKDRAAFPEYDPAMAVSKGFDRTANLWTVFSGEFDKVHGKAFATPAELLGFFQSQNLSFGYCDPKLFEVMTRILPDGVLMETAFDRAKVDDYQFGITRASGAIAETGSLILRDKETSSRLGALAPWVHIACLERGAIHATIHEALKVMPDDPNVIWVTGPSKTADIEGILVEGVHGPGIQAVFLLP